MSHSTVDCNFTTFRSQRSLSCTKLFCTWQTFVVETLYNYNLLCSVTCSTSLLPFKAVATSLYHIIVGNLVQFTMQYIRTYVYCVVCACTYIGLNLYTVVCLYACVCIFTVHVLHNEYTGFVCNQIVYTCTFSFQCVCCNGFWWLSQHLCVVLCHRVQHRQCLLAPCPANTNRKLCKHQVSGQNHLLMTSPWYSWKPSGCVVVRSVAMSLCDIIRPRGGYSWRMPLYYSLPLPFHLVGTPPHMEDQHMGGRSTPEMDYGNPMRCVHA